MNIYLDIDGVLLSNEDNLALHTEEFLNKALDTYPDSTYWLTTHCWRGKNRTVELLSPLLTADTVGRLALIKPTQWGELKTDAIDLSQPFLWFDDDLYREEREVLEAHGALNGWVEINLHKDPNQLAKYIPTFPYPATTPA